MAIDAAELIVIVELLLLILNYVVMCWIVLTVLGMLVHFSYISWIAWLKRSNLPCTLAELAVPCLQNCMNFSSSL